MQVNYIIYIYLILDSNADLGSKIEKSGTFDEEYFPATCRFQQPSSIENNNHVEIASFKLFQWFRKQNFYSLYQL